MFSEAKIAEVNCLDVREKMIKYREDHYLSLEKMAKKTKVVPVILDIVENGGVTHPNFVKRIKKGYELTEQEAELLLPEVRRKSSPKYDPDHFVRKVDINTLQLMPRQEEVDRYITEHNKKRSMI